MHERASPAVLLLLFATFAHAQSPSVIAHASDSSYWIAISESDGATPPIIKTRLQRRTIGGSAAWQAGPDVIGRAVELASRGDQLLVRIETGEWFIATLDSLTAGPPLPDGAAALALTGDGDGLYALGLAASTPSTQPSTRPTPAAERQFTTLPELWLYRFEAGRWRGLARVPTSFPLLVGQQRLVARGDGVHLGALTNDGSVVLARYDAKGWSKPQTLTPSKPAKRIAWLVAGDRPAVGVESEASRELFTLVGDAWRGPTTLPTSLPSSGLVSAGGTVRTVYVKDGKLFEQSIGLDGVPAGQPITLMQPSAQPPPRSSWWQLLLLGAMVAVVASVLGRRGEVRSEAIERGTLRLATPGIRLAAGLIDFAPVVIAAMMIEQRYKQLQLAGEVIDTTQAAAYTAILFGAYLLYTFLFEWLSARTVGKIVFGLRVCDLEGKRPTFRAILIRNALRIFDVFPVVPMAAIVFFTPLRQRLGDMAAKTVVVSDRAKEEPASEDAEAE